MALDLRRIRVGVEISGRLQWYEGLRVRAQGTKYASPTKNEATITLTGLSQKTRDYLLTETSPFNANRTPKRVYLEVGRQSGGMFRLYVGDITSAEPSSPPDIDLILRSKTQASAANTVVAKSAPATTRLSDLVRTVAADLGLAPVFEAQDIQIANYQHAGSNLAQVQALQDVGGVSAYVDDGELIVKDANRPLSNRIRILNKDSGMVGLPKATEKGLSVTFLLDPETKIGGALRVQSALNPALDGDYLIKQLKFDVASHDDPFFYTAECTRL
ncbi:baseplate hub protein [Azotobacter salinestris]|uniref:baseplate hub protein n=1 Tax=Azotobacter salinestris TaxID=69964 RepID=UPI001266A674|nr:hypothetical protein [Azotobacter salinestris]